MSTRFTRRALAVAAVVTAAGCAPATFSASGLTFGGTPGSWGSFSQCSPLNASPEATRMGIRSPMIQAFSLRQLSYQLQSRMTYAQSGIGQMESYKGIAAGGC